MYASLQPFARRHFFMPIHEGGMRMRDFISVHQLSEMEIFQLLRKAEYYRKQEVQFNEKLFIANLFFEPSTRTKMSFAVAEQKLGLHVLDFHTETSSVQKGESLYDTVKTFEAIGANLVVIRHESDHWFEELKGKLSIPIINAGSGKEEHPTQCMLDLLTIYQEFGRFEGLNIVIAGDIKHSRVARSNAYALQRLGANVYVSSAPGFVDDTLHIPNLPMDEAVEVCDVLMLLRIQHERHTNQAETANYLTNYGLTKERESRMKNEAILLHPAPVNRGVEIDSDLVECTRSRIFKQMNNGVYMRMAIISELLQNRGVNHEDTFNKRETVGAF